MANNKNINYNQYLNKKKKKTNNKKNYLAKDKMHDNKLENTSSFSKKEINKKRYEARKQRYSYVNNSEKKRVIKLDDTLKDNLSNTDILFPKKKNGLQNKTIVKQEAQKDNDYIKNISDANILVKVEKNQSLEQKNNNLENSIDKQEQSNQEILLNEEYNVQIEEENFLKKKKIDNTKTLINIIKKENITLDNNKEGNKKRVKKYLKEAIVFSILITFINILVIWLFDDINMLKLFDVMYANLIVTVVLSLIMSYAISFFVDCLITEIWVKRKNKQKEGAQNGDNRT